MNSLSNSIIRRPNIPEKYLHHFHLQFWDRHFAVVVLVPIQEAQLQSHGNKDALKSAPQTPKGPPLLEPGFSKLEAVAREWEQEVMKQEQNHESYEWCDQLANHSYEGSATQQLQQTPDAALQQQAKPPQGTRSMEKETAWEVSR
ncbi:hypothetical protein OIU74_011629 [Salix koriyanagi]|uniref:Uncharacterized protein n=1 Tax=Salix koriyanagi TaxID=2511006 RepID=A0A9Q0TFQ0_9ROSI|nr:hypothetical protein OIU74_011629 [Salix koriyanagi]